MRTVICVATVLALSASSSQLAAKSTSFQLNSTTWKFTDPDGVKVIETIDAKGNYIENSIAGKHVDHGTAVMKDDKACFTSAMTKDGEVCWTTKPVKIGHVMHTVSDKGEKLAVTRVAYKPLKMPK
jgi:hypothetical protein